MKKIIISLSLLIVSLSYAQVKRHTVQPKETLYGLSKQYNVSQKQLKEANPFLYDRGLQIGDVLDIPGTVVVSESETMNIPEPTIENYEDNDFYYVAVKPKQTLYRLAKEYEVSQDVIKSLNPYISERGLQIKDVVRIPKNKRQQQSSKKPVADGMYEVQAGDTVSSIARANGLEIADIYAANKSIQVEGLKAGSYIKIPEKRTVTIERNWFKHKVQKGETVFGLLRKYSISLDELLKNNPDLSGGLQTGMTLSLPMEKGAVIEEVEVVETNIDIPKGRVVASQDNEINIVCMMPFFLDQPSGYQGERKVAQEFYMGMQVALDEVVRKGKKVNIKIIDTQNDRRKVDEFINSPEILKYDAVVGPFFQDLVEYTAQKLEKNNIAVFSPIVNTGKLEDNSNLYLVEPKDEYAVDIIADEIGGKYNGQVIKILTSPSEKQVAEYLEKKLKKKYNDPIVKIVYDAKDLELEEKEGSTEENKKYKQEIAILASENQRLGKQFVEVITQQDPNSITGYSVFFVLALDVFDTNNKKNIDKLKNIGFTYTAKRMINGFGTAEKQILSAFKDKYCQKPSKYMAMGYDVMFDVIDRMDDNGNISAFDKKRTETRLSSKIGYDKADTGKAKVNRQMRVIRLYNK